MDREAHRLAVGMVRQYGDLALSYPTVRRHYPGRLERVLGRLAALYALLAALRA